MVLSREGSLVQKRVPPVLSIKFILLIDPCQKTHKKNNISISYVIKNIVTLDDLNNIGQYFYEFIQISKEQLEASRQIGNFKQKIPHQVLALENMCKPLALSNLIPTPLEKWEITDEDFKGYLKATSDHEYKQIVSAKYGTTLGHLKYKHWIPDTDLNMLQIIKEKYQQADSGFPYSDEQAKRLSIKLDDFLEERLYSKSHTGLLDLYATPEKSIARVRGIALMKIFPFISQYQAFAESVDKTNLSYEELVIKAKTYKTEEPKFDKQFVPIIVADEDNFQEVAMKAMNELLSRMKVIDARKARNEVNQKAITGLRNIETIIENSSREG